MTRKMSPRARRQARRALVQAVYQWQMTDTPIHELTAEFRDSGTLDKADEVFFAELLRGVLHGSGDLDSLFEPFLDRKTTALDRVELAILRLGAFELKYKLDVPYRVVIDEYVDLAKLFGAEDSYKYINGVLDRLATILREIERPAR